MNFTGIAYPLGLLGLFSVPIILALHLLRERNRHYTVSSLRLWSFLEPEVRGSRFQKIPISWLLITQLLIAILLSIAWSQPQFSRKLLTKDSRHHIILLDVSTSMSAQDILPNRFYHAQTKAISLLANLSPKDVATLITFGSSARLIGDTRQTELTELVERIYELHPSHPGHELELALALGLAATSGELPVQVHILTDGAFPDIDLQTLTEPIDWHFSGKQVSNQAVMHLSVLPIGSDDYQILARVANFGEEASKQVITLLADGDPVDSTTITLDADSVITQLWTISGSPSVVTVSLIGGDYYPPDDSASIGIQVDNKVRVGLVAEEPNPLDRALSVLPNVDLRILSPEEYQIGMSFDVLIFRGYLPETWVPGIVVVFEPPTNSSLLQVRGLEELWSMPVPSADPLFDNVDFGGVRWSDIWSLENAPEYLSSILHTESQDIILRGRIGSSQIVTVLADLESGNLVQHPSFPVLIANLVNSSQRGSLPAQVQLGESIPLPLAINYPFITTLTPKGDVINLSNHRYFERQKIKDPGVYHFELVDIDGKTHHKALGVNAGIEGESDIRPREWTENYEVRGSQLTEIEMEREINIIPWILSITVLLLFVEARLAWR